MKSGLLLGVLIALITDTTWARSRANIIMDTTHTGSSHLEHRHHHVHLPAKPSLVQTKNEPFSESALLEELSECHNEDEEALILPDPRGGAAAASTSDSAMATVLQNLKIGFYFALWYALNIVYNIVNKKVLNVLPAPLIVGSIQFGVGALYVAVLWLLKLRPKPQLSGAKAKQAVRTVGFWHCAGQLLSMVSLGAGPVSFTHIVKALEPFFSALVAALYFGKWMHPVVYSTLLPVVGGVGYACLKEKSFSWLAFGTAMGSNLAFALRAVLSKMAMTSSEGGENPLGTNLSAPNMFGLVTCAAFWISIPLGLAAEGPAFFRSAGTTASPEDLGPIALPSLWQTAVESSEHGAAGLIRSIILSGLFHYLNNEVMYLALGQVHPVTLAVGNTMKRVFIMVASVMVFKNKISLQAGIGSAIGISGVLLYSLTKQHYEALEKAKAEKEKASKRSSKGGALKVKAPVGRRSRK